MIYKTANLLGLAVERFNVSIITNFRVKVKKQLSIFESCFFGSVVVVVYNLEFVTIDANINQFYIYNLAYVFGFGKMEFWIIYFFLRLLLFSFSNCFRLFLGVGRSSGIVPSRFFNRFSNNFSYFIMCVTSLFFCIYIIFFQSFFCLRYSK